MTPRRTGRGGRRRGVRAGTPAAPELAAPRGLAASSIDLGNDRFALLEWPFSCAPAPVTLTEAEREVLALLERGLSNAEIARSRGRSPRTVANQVASIFEKLGVGSRSELHARRATRPRLE